MKKVGVEFTTHALGQGRAIALARLVNEASLNALSPEMVEALLAQFTLWDEDPSIVAVWFEGRGEKAFCAGGDVLAMRAEASCYDEVRDCPRTQSFFTQEYRLNFLLHNYTKPIIAWGHGIVMGGGIGIFAPASHRVVTQSSRLAMPEIVIGLFPDVGGAYFLNKLRGSSGYFLGLTGANINAGDALLIGLADYFVADEGKQALFDDLLQLRWTDTAEENHQRLNEFFDAQQQAQSVPLPKSRLAPHLAWIDQQFSGTRRQQVANLCAYAGVDEWLNKSIETLRRGCPVSALLTLEQLQRGRDMTLADILRMEWVMAINCMREGNLREGVRALLVDKDKLPKWQPASLAEVSDDSVASHFLSPWLEGDHPLANLGS